jgi:hypothetical protein
MEVAMVGFGAGFSDAVEYADRLNRGRVAEFAGTAK